MTTPKLTTEQAKKMVESFEKTPFIQKKLEDAKSKASNIVEQLKNFTNTKI
jgi:hypothetical protein